MKWASLPLLAVVLSLPSWDGVISQTLPPREQIRQRVNDNVLFLMGGQPGATFSQLAHDISVVVEDGNNLRVLPVVGGAAVQNVEDVLYLRSIDMALTTQEAMNHLKSTGELGPHLEQQLTYIATLFPNPLQILARAGAKSVTDLSGKKVNFNNKGSATAQFVPKIFKTLGIDVQELYMAQGDAMEKLRSGEIDATICSCPTPVPAFANVKPDWGLRFVTLREVTPGDLSAGFDQQRRLSHSGREGSGDNCRNHRPSFIQLAKRLGTIQTDRKVRRCFLLKVRRVPQAAASPALEDGKSGRNHSRMDPFSRRRGMAQKLACGPG